MHNGNLAGLLDAFGRKSVQDWLQFFLQHKWVIFHWKGANDKTVDFLAICRAFCRASYFRGNTTFWIILMILSSFSVVFSRVREQNFWLLTLLRQFSMNLFSLCVSEDILDFSRSAESIFYGRKHFVNGSNKECFSDLLHSFWIIFIDSDDRFWPIRFCRTEERWNIPPDATSTKFISLVIHVLQNFLLVVSLKTFKKGIHGLNLYN